MCLVRCFSCCLGCPWPSTFSIRPCCFSFSLLVHLFFLTRNDLIRLDSYPKYIHSSVDPHRDGRSTICKSHPHVTHCRDMLRTMPSATQRYCAAGPIPVTESTNGNSTGKTIDEQTGGLQQQSQLSQLLGEPPFFSVPPKIFNSSRQATQTKEQPGKSSITHHPVIS